VLAQKAYGYELIPGFVPLSFTEETLQSATPASHPDQAVLGTNEDGVVLVTENGSTIINWNDIRLIALVADLVSIRRVQVSPKLIFYPLSVPDADRALLAAAPPQVQINDRMRWKALRSDTPKEQTLPRRSKVAAIGLTIFGIVVLGLGADVAVSPSTNPNAGNSQIELSLIFLALGGGCFVTGAIGTFRRMRD
jgi:hypothetical protein